MTILLFIYTMIAVYLKTLTLEVLSNSNPISFIKQTFSIMKYQMQADITMT